MTWDKYQAYVEKHFRFMRTGDFVIGSVPYLFNDDGETIKTLWIKMRWEPGVKKRLKYLLAEKLPSVWDQIPSNRKGE